MQKTSLAFKDMSTKLPNYEKRSDGPPPTQEALDFATLRPYGVHIGVEKIRRVASAMKIADAQLQPLEGNYQLLFQKYAEEKKQYEATQAAVPNIPSSIIDLHGINPAWSADRLESFNVKEPQIIPSPTPTANELLNFPEYPSQEQPVIIENGEIERVGEKQYDNAVNARAILNQIHSGIDFPMPGSQN